MHNLSNSNPTLTNVTFVGNQTDTSGGGVYNQDSSPILTNVIFSGNSAVEDGGGMYGNNYSSSTLTGVTFSGNRAQSEGGAIYNEYNSDATIQNSILWNNQDSSGTGTANSSLVNVTSTPVIRYSLVQGCNPGGAWTSSCGTDAGNNLADVDPLLVTAVNPASAPTTAGNLRLQATSPAVNAGDNALIPSGVTTDLDGNARIQQNIVDMGAYESSFSPTAATVGGFAAELHADRVRLHWTTLNEVGLTGFHLYRGLDAAGPGERITAAPLPGQGAGGLEGFAYAYEDFTPRPAEAAVFYWLEEAHSSGEVFRHGPQRIATADGLRVFLPVVGR
jgi:predicted outer membrane repeat protein